MLDPHPFKVYDLTMKDWQTYTAAGMSTDQVTTESILQALKKLEPFKRPEIQEIVIDGQVQAIFQANQLRISAGYWSRLKKYLTTIQPIHSSPALWNCFSGLQILIDPDLPKPSTNPLAQFLTHCTIAR